MVHYTLSYQDAYTHQIWNSYLKEYQRYAPDTIFGKTRSGQGYSDPIVVCDTQSSQDGLTHQIWNPNLKENKQKCTRLNAASRNKVRGQVYGHSDPNMKRDTSSF